MADPVTGPPHPPGQKDGEQDQQQHRNPQGHDAGETPAKPNRRHHHDGADHGHQGNRDGPPVLPVP